MCLRAYVHACVCVIVHGCMEAFLCVWAVGHTYIRHMYVCPTAQTHGNEKYVHMLVLGRLMVYRFNQSFFMSNSIIVNSASKSIIHRK